MGERLECGDCLRVFRPGCLKHYISYRNSNPCCALNLSNMPLSSSSSSSDPQSSATLDSILALLNKNDATLNAFISRQSKFNNDMATKINAIEGIVKTVAEHGERIAQLEATTASLSRETDSLRALATRASPTITAPTAAITIAGIPTAISDSPLCNRVKNSSRTQCP